MSNTKILLEYQIEINIGAFSCILSFLSCLGSGIMSLRDLIVESWFIVWEKLVSHVPLPRGLADFAVVLIIVTVLVAIHRLHRGLFRAILVLLWGVLVVSVVFYLVGD